MYEIEGAKDILAKLINDADLEVAMIADQAAGDVSDEDFIGMIAGRLTFAAGTEAAKKHTFASVGLNAYWTGSQWYEKTGEKAYKAWFEHITKITPAADFDTPSFVAVSVDFKRNRGNERS